jgi:hypothetical protein
LGDEQFATDAVDILVQFGMPELVTTLEGEEVKPSKELARRYVVQLAEKFRVDSFLSQDAPRVGSEVKQLLHIQGIVKDLHLALRESHDLTRIAFQAGCIKFADGFPESPLIKQCNAAGLPLPGRIGASGEPSEWERTLEALDLFLGHCLRLRSSKVDRGGATNGYISVWGSPASALVESAWYVFEMFRPGKATGYGDGPFQGFVETVAEYATGEGGINLDQAVKRWAKELRESAFETAALKRLRLERMLPTTSPERLEEIRKEEDAILFKEFPVGE